MTFDINWDLDIYKKKRQFNKHPYDKIVSSINRYFNKKKISVQKLTALDLGCGTGNNTKFLCEYGFRKVIGIDGSKSAIKFAKNFLKKNKNCQLFVKDFNKINFTERSISVCIDRGSITHNSKKNIDLIFSEVHKILKRNGIFISCLFSKNHYAYQKKKNLFFKKETGAKSGLVTSFFDKKEIKRLFKNFKTEIIIHEINFNVISKKKSSMWFVVAKKL